MTAPRRNKVHPTKAWQHPLFEQRGGTFIPVSGKNVLSEMAS